MVGLGGCSVGTSRSLASLLPMATPPRPIQASTRTMLECNRGRRLPQAGSRLSSCVSACLSQQNVPRISVQRGHQKHALAAVGQPEACKQAAGVWRCAAHGRTHAYGGGSSNGSGGGCSNAGGGASSTSCGAPPALHTTLWAQLLYPRASRVSTMRRMAGGCPLARSSRASTYGEGHGRWREVGGQRRQGVGQGVLGTGCRSGAVRTRCSGYAGSREDEEAACQLAAACSRSGEGVGGGGPTFSSRTHCTGRPSCFALSSRRNTCLSRPLDCRRGKRSTASTAWREQAAGLPRRRGPLCRSGAVHVPRWRQQTGGSHAPRHRAPPAARPC